MLGGLKGRRGGAGAGSRHNVEKKALEGKGPRTPAPEGGGLWKKREINGQTVHTRDDLIDPELTDARGRTNLERMEKGLAPIGPDGKSMNLHHMTQQDGRPLAEMTETFHKKNHKTIHINDNKTPSGIDRDAFKKTREAHWKARAEDFRE